MTTYKLILFSMLLCSCHLRSAKQTSPLVGKWNMTHYYADIGDGKETWHEADKERTIEFRKDGVFIDSDNKSSSKYVLLDSTNIEIIPEDKSKAYKMKIVELTEKNLVLRANCIEGCGEKYARAK